MSNEQKQSVQAGQVERRIIHWKCRLGIHDFHCLEEGGEYYEVCKRCQYSKELIGNPFSCLRIFLRWLGK